MDLENVTVFQILFCKIICDTADLIIGYNIVKLLRYHHPNYE